MGEVQDLITKKVRREYNTSKETIRKVYSIRHYRCYNKKGYNSCTYKVETDNAKVSNKSKE